jgi:arylformamidase
VNVSAITLSPHVGAHADAPLHYAAEGVAIGGVDLEPFLGPCRVVHAIDCGPLITQAHLAEAMNRAPVPTRLIVRTARRAATRWSDDFAAFDPTTIAWLAGLGVRLVGIDTPSVDPADSKTLLSHQQLLAHDMRVLENLVLDEVDAGDYELIALPLRLTGADASPVRAVLRKLL